MSKKIELPDAYVQVMEQYADANHQTFETAFANLFDFIQIKDESFQRVQIAIEEPKQYLTDPEDLNAPAVRQMFMDIFGEDTVGATVRCYYDEDRAELLLLDVEYDSEIPLWNILEMFHNKIPGMDIVDDVLRLHYVTDGYGEIMELIEEIRAELLDPEHDDSHETAGYYESIFDDPEQEDMLEDAMEDMDEDIDKGQDKCMNQAADDSANEAAEDEDEDPDLEGE